MSTRPLWKILKQIPANKLTLDMLEAWWWRCEGGVVEVWWRCGGGVWWRCGGGVEEAWWRCGGDVVEAW